MSPLKQLLYVCINGLGDEPIPELGGRSPLEAARTPLLDRLAAGGRQGLVHTVGEGVAPDSDAASLGLLGYEPRTEHPGRGVVEALGAGLAFADGDLALRVNFATRDGPAITDRRVGRDLSSEEARELGSEVTGGVRLTGAFFDLAATGGYRGALVIRSNEGPLSARVSNTDPAYRREGPIGIAREGFDARVLVADPLDGTEQAARTAEQVNDFIESAGRVLGASEVNRRRIEDGRLPANLLLTRGAGDRVPRLGSVDRRFGPAWGTLAETAMDRGLAETLGMGLVDAPTAGSTQQRLGASAALVVEALGGFDAMFVQLRGPDAAAHDGDPHGKLAGLSEIDESFFGPLLSLIDFRRVLLVVTADHATSSIRRVHTADAVPLLIAGQWVSGDGVQRFGERAARDGRLGTTRGVEVLPRVVGLLR